MYSTKHRNSYILHKCMRIDYLKKQQLSLFVGLWFTSYINGINCTLFCVMPYVKQCVNLIIKMYVFIFYFCIAIMTILKCLKGKSMLWIIKTFLLHKKGYRILVLQNQRKKSSLKYENAMQNWSWRGLRPNVMSNYANHVYWHTVWFQVGECHGHLL